jgi:hypothetical protein
MFPRPVTDEKLKLIRQQEAKRLEQYDAVGYDPDSAGHQISAAMRRANQERFLSVFALCLSPRLACKQADVSLQTYQRWRSSDSWFAEQLNTVMDDWREELLSSAVTRAIGYTRADENGELVRDASGKVIYTDGSDSLARQLLQMDQGEKGNANPTVIVNIDFAAAGYVASITDSALEGEFTEVDANDRIPTYDDSRIR